MSQAKDIATAIGVAIALFTFLKGVIEYVRQGAQKRAEQFALMRSRLKENDTFKELCALLETDDPKLAEIPFKEKRDLLGFFEEVALMTNSSLIRNEVAHYMFGYYAIKCWESKYFWSTINRESIYWSLFRDFVEQMKQVKQSFQYNRRKFRY